MSPSRLGQCRIATGASVIQRAFQGGVQLQILPRAIHEESVDALFQTLFPRESRPFPRGDLSRGENYEPPRRPPLPGIDGTVADATTTFDHPRGNFTFHSYPPSARQLADTNTRFSSRGSGSRRRRDSRVSSSLFVSPNRTRGLPSAVFKDRAIIGTNGEDTNPVGLKRNERKRENRVSPATLSPAIFQLRPVPLVPVFFFEVVKAAIN